MVDTGIGFPAYFPVLRRLKLLPIKTSTHQNAHVSLWMKAESYEGEATLRED